MTSAPKQTSTFDCELTDTFGGEANYCWVRRAQIVVPYHASQRVIVRAAKKALGLTGIRCDTDYFGDSVTIRPRGMCLIAFVTWHDPSLD